MTSPPLVKICGILTPDTLEAAISAGASFVGLVFHPASPRHVSADAAAFLSRQAARRAKIVGLFVDPDDDTLTHITKHAVLDMVQLHGNEDPGRVAGVRSRTGLPVVKAIRVAGPEDLEDIALYEAVADWLLFDARVPGQAGGTGVAFDWTLLRNTKLRKPWMLSGGLHAGNVRTALGIVRPDAVDVSSGVEDSPGVKSAEKIRAFIQTVRQFS